jgi:hypothetical protein
VVNHREQEFILYLNSLAEGEELGSNLLRVFQSSSEGAGGQGSESGGRRQPMAAFVTCLWLDGRSVGRPPRPSRLQTTPGGARCTRRPGPYGGPPIVQASPLPQRSTALRQAISAPSSGEVSHRSGICTGRNAAERRRGPESLVNCRQWRTVDAGCTALCLRARR